MNIKKRDSFEVGSFLDESTPGIMKGSKNSLDELKVEIKLEEKDIEKAAIIANYVDQNKAFALG